MKRTAKITVGLVGLAIILVLLEMMMVGCGKSKTSEKKYEYADLGISLVAPQGWEEALGFIGGKPSAPTLMTEQGKPVTPTIDTIFVHPDWKKTKAEIRYLIYPGKFDLGDLLLKPLPPLEGKQISFVTRDGYEILAAPVTTKIAKGTEVRSKLTLTDPVTMKDVRLTQGCVYFRNDSALLIVLFRAEDRAFQDIEPTAYRGFLDKVFIKDSGGSELVVGLANPIDKERGTIQTYLTSSDLIALWSKMGWRGNHVYLNHDSETDRHKGKLPWVTQNGEIVWLGADTKDSGDYIRLLVWKVKGFQDFDGRDAPVELNKAGEAFLLNLFEMNYVVLTGTVSADHRAFLMSRKLVQQSQAAPPKEWSIAIGIGDDGRVVDTLEFTKSGAKDWFLKSKISLSRPVWYPRPSFR